jgi:hypothetical protein
MLLDFFLIKNQQIILHNAIKFYKNGTPANKACNKACDAMLANDGVKSGNMVVVTNNAGNGRAGSTNGNAGKAITYMSNAIDQNVPTKVNVDYKPGSGSADKMGDHFVVVEGKAETIKNGQVTSTTFRYFDPGTHDPNKGTSPNNTLNVVNRTLSGYSNVLRRDVTVTNIRPSK